MPLISQLTLLLLLIFPAHQQTPQPASACRLETKYDRFTDTTTLQCELVNSSEPLAKLTVQANLSFRGREPSGPQKQREVAKFWLSFSSNRGGATRQTPPLFQDAPTVYLLTETAKWELAVIEYRYTYFELIRSVSESARAELSLAQLHKLLAVQRLAGKWGDVEFKLSGAALAAFKDFIVRQILANPTQ